MRTSRQKAKKTANPGSKKKSERALAEARQRFIDAGQVVGSTPNEQLEWLWNFAHVDLSAAAVESIGEQVLYFLASNFRRRPEAAGRTIGALEPLDISSLREIQADTRDGFRRLVEGTASGPMLRAWLAKPGWVWLTWHREPPDDPSRWRVSVATGGSTLENFRGAVFDLLLEAGPRLRACDEPGGCGRLFAATRPHQRHCGATCANRVRSRRHYADNSEKISTQRRERYKDKILNRN